MDIEQQVCSLELSKKLLTLGVKQNSSSFYWAISHLNNKYKDTRIHYTYEIEYLECTGWIVEIIAVAFTVAELGEMLLDWHESIKRADKDWVCIIRHKNSDINDHSFATTEADARAKMLIHLIENKLIEIPE